MVRRSLWAARCAALLAFTLAATTLAAGPAPAAPAHGPRDMQATGGAPASGEIEAVPGRLLVTVDGQPDLSGAVADLGGRVQRLTEDVHLVQVDAARQSEAEQALRMVAGVRAVEPDLVRPWARVPDDALFAEQWSHSLTEAHRAWDTTVGDAAVRIALIDSGVRGDHPELAPNIVEQLDLSNGTPVERGRGVDNDTCEIGHGTQVAGILGAVGDNGMGVAGVAWQVGLVDLAVSSMATAGSCDGASDSAVLAALHYATYNPAGPVDVVNLSVGGRQAFCPEAYERAIDEARREGVVVVAAAGNSGPETAQVPASCPGVIAVGAVDVDERVPAYSATNAWVDLVAPGGGDSKATRDMLWTTSRRGDWTRVRGTSFAAPYVSGVAALLRSVNRDISPDEVESVLERSADDGGAGRTDEHGWGVVHAARALGWVRRGVNIPPPEDEPYFPVLRVHPPEAGPGPLRIGPADGPTDPVLLAAQLSRTVFREAGAVHAVVARADHFADALAGSALGMGVGPLLFNPRGEELAPQVRKELRRSLPEGARVYVLGGERGLGRGVADELRAMGYGVARLSGPTREETAVQVAREIARIRRRGGMPPVSEVILATRGDWPDAVGAGALAARWAIPVLLTEPEHLHPATRKIIEELRPETLTVVGSAGRVSDEVALEAQRAGRADRLLRLAGASRHGTMAEVSKEALRRMGVARVAIALNVRRDDAYAHALSASVAAAAYGGVFVALEGRRGDAISEPAGLLLEDALQRRVQPADLLGVLVGGEDVVSAGAAEELERLLRR